MEKTAFFRSKQRYFPQFSRSFSARPFLWISLGLVFGWLASNILWTQTHKSARSFFPTPFSTALTTETSAAQKSYEQWKHVVEKQPDYRDGYLMLAWFSKKLGQSDEARTYIQKVMELDPSYSIPEVFSIEKEELRK